MKKHLKIIISIIIGIITVSGLFYWYSFRPASIISKCSFEARENAVKKHEDRGVADGKFSADDRDVYFRWCLQENGLIK